METEESVQVICPVCRVRFSSENNLARHRLGYLGVCYDIEEILATRQRKLEANIERRRLDEIQIMEDKKKRIEVRIERANRIKRIFGPFYNVGPYEYYARKEGLISDRFKHNFLVIEAPNLEE